ncbi:MAG: TIGR01777 family oxidoreductase [Marinoscillum sp.]
MKRIVIAGGTGFIGKILTKHFTSQGTEVVILTRRHQVDRDLVRYEKWDGKSAGAWQNVLNGAESLINLNGKSVDCRYSEANKQAIYDSRIDATYILGEALKGCKHPPAVWINAASATIYRHAEDRDMDEATGELGTGFSVDVCKKWERTFFETDTPDVRKVALRIAITLGKRGGALEPLKRLVHFGLGGKQGNGRQYFSWIHESDVAAIVEWVLGNDQAAGVYNVAAPHPVPNKLFMQLLRREMKVPFGLPSPEWLLNLGALLIRTEPELILKSRRVVPGRLLNEGYVFNYKRIESAFKSLVNR